MKKNEKRLTPRQRALYPGNSKSYIGPQVTLSIKLDKYLYEWLKSFAGTDSFFFDVEETIVTALRCMKGDDLTLDHLADLVSSEVEKNKDEEMGKND